LIAEFLLILLC